MGCCVSGASNAKVEPWPSYHDSFEAKSSTSNAYRKHVSQTGQSENEIKQTKKPSPYEDKHMTNKNEVRPRSSTARRTASTQTKESSFRSSSKSHPKEQDAITKSRISRLIQVTEADFSSTKDKTSLDKEKETTEDLASLSQTDETRTTTDGNLEKPTPEEAVKDVSTKETKDSLELEDIEDTEESQVKDLLPSDIKSVTLEARNEIINSEVDRNTDEELKDGIPVKGNDGESQGDSREPDEALLPPASLTGKPTDNAEIAVKKEVGEDVHEACSVCLATAPPSAVAGEEKNTKPATEKEAGEEVHEVCSVCLATAPPQVVATEESKEETVTTLTEDPEAVLPDTVASDSAKELNEDKAVGEEVHEACSVCLATAPPSTVAGEEKNTRPVTEKEVGEEVHEVCSVCLATAPPLAVATEESKEETATTLTEDPEAVLPDTVAADSAKVLNEDKAVGEEVHEACSVCLATAPLPSKTEGHDAENVTELADALYDTEDGDTKQKVIAKEDAGEEIHEACSVCLATAPPPTITTEERETIELPSTSAAPAGTTEVTEEERVGEEMHEACSVCLATAPPSTIATVGENTERSADKEAGEEPHEVCSVCLATGPPPTTTAEVNEANKVKETSPEYLPTDEVAATGEVEKEGGEVHEACSVCIATAPPPSTTGVLEIAHVTEEKHAVENADKVTEEKVVGEEVHEACSVCLATAPLPVVTAERTETADEKEANRPSSTFETGADTVRMVTEGKLVGEEVHEACSVCLATAPPAATVTKEEATKITAATPTSTSKAEANITEKVTTETGEREKVQEKTIVPEGTDQPPSIAAEADMTGLDSNKSSTIPAEGDNAEDTEASAIAAEEGKTAVNEHQTTAAGKVTAEANVPPTIETEGTEEPNESAVNTSEDIAEHTEPPTVPKEDNSGDSNEAQTIASEVGTAEATEFPTTATEDITEEGNAETTESPRIAEDGPVESTKSPAVSNKDTAEAAEFQTTAKEVSTEERITEVTESPTIATEDGPAESPESPAVPENCTAGSTQTPPAVGTVEGTAEVSESPIITTENADTESPTTASEGTGGVTTSLSGETEEGTPKISETLSNETEGIDVREESQKGTGEGSAESTHFPTAETEEGNGHATASPTVATEHTAEAIEIAEVTAETTGTEEVSESPTDTVEGTAEVTGSPTNVIEATEPATVASEGDKEDKPDSTTPETKEVTSETASADTHTQDEAAEAEAAVPTGTENAADETTTVQGIQEMQESDQGVSEVDASTKSEEPDVVMKEEGANPLDDNNNANKVTSPVTESDDHMDAESNVGQQVDSQAIKVNA